MKSLRVFPKGYKMKKEYQGINAMAAIKWGAALLTSIWASLSGTIHILVIMMAIDFATGVLYAINEKKLDSSISFKGLIKKTMTLIMVYVCHMITKPMNLAFDLGEVIALGYVANEVISITENCARVGVPIPPVIMDALAKFKSLQVSTADGTTASDPMVAGKIQTIETLTKKTTVELIPPTAPADSQSV